ncbi:MAG: hypothetical protein Q8P64_19520 [Deltaproteobacteria bacterium]|nr:hypothetical protein [Deltaproteobacteria bacterium]
MYKKWVIFIAVMLLPSWAVGDKDIPNDSQIQEWWKPENRKKPNEKLEVNKVVPIRLTGKEEAFLAAVYFPERGRNFFSGALLVRPSQKEARQVQEVGDHFEVHDLDLDGVSEISTKIVGSGQGTTAGEKILLYFDGWKPVVLYKKAFGDNLGACGEYLGHRCYSEEVVWTFTDLDGDDKRDLVELVIKKEGKETDKLRWATKVNVFLLKQKRFIPAAHTMGPNQRTNK